MRGKSLLPYPFFEVMQLSPRSRCRRDPSAGFSFSQQLLNPPHCRILFQCGFKSIMCEDSLSFPSAPLKCLIIRSVIFDDDGTKSLLGSLDQGLVHPDCLHVDGCCFLLFNALKFASLATACSYFCLPSNDNKQSDLTNG